MVRKLLVVARHKPVEALRVAAGLTLADAELQVLALGGLPDDENARTQLEALAFAEIEPRVLPTEDAQAWTEIARSIVASEAVYLL